MYGNRLLLVLCLVLMGGITVAYAQQEPALPQWSPSPELLKKLGASVTIEGFSLQPPADYKRVVPKSGVPEGVSNYVWVGPARNDRTHPVLMLSLIVPSGAKPQNLTLNEIAKSLLEEIKAARNDWKQTEMAAGIVQGLQCVQVGWTGTDRKENRKMQGFMVVALEGNTIVELSSQDIVPYTEQSLPVAEAATRTFKRPDPRVYFTVQWPGHGQIYSMDPDGANRVCLTPLSDTDYRPALSPDGTTIAFTTHRDGVRSLYLMDMDGTNQRRVTQKEDAGLCAWSPDGSQLAFSSNRNGHYCIYVMNRDGSHVRRLTEGPSDDFPAWSPDGRQIAYEGMPDKTWRIFLENVDGSGPAKPITKGTWSERWPQWSPDSEAIVYTSYQQGKGQIYVMRPDGTSVTRLTKTTAEDREPSFTADSRQVLFHSDRGGKFEIYTLDFATRQERRLAAESKDTTQVTTLGRSHSLTP